MCPTGNRRAQLFTQRPPAVIFHCYTNAMFGIHLGQAREKIVAVADIGSGNVSVVILSLRPGGPATALAASRAILPIQERTPEARIAGLGEQIVRAGEQAQKIYSTRSGGDVNPVTELYAIIRTPWSRSKTAHATTVLAKQTRVTDATIRSLAQQALASEKELDAKNFMEAGVIRIELNGYPTSEPDGKYATEVSVFAFVSDCEPLMRAQATASLQKVFPHLVPVLRSGMRELVSVLRHMPYAERDYVILDIACEGATIAAIYDGVAMEHQTLAEGTRAILQRVSDSGTPEETLSLMRMLAREDCSSPECEKIRDAMARVEPDLVRGFGGAMGTLATARRLPSTLVLSAEPDMAPWLSAFFARIDFTQFTLTTQPFTVKRLLPADFSGWVKPESGVTLDTGQALSVAFVQLEQST